MEKKLYIAALIVYIGAGCILAYRSYQLGTGPSDEELLKAIENGVAKLSGENIETVAAQKAAEQ